MAFLARGGLGQVWRAVRDTDGLEVALKLPNDSDPDIAERFQAEAQALRILDHPGIVRLEDFTHDAAGNPVLVMEYVEGAPLRSLLPPEGCDFAEALALFLPVLEAVQFAHARGVVHRDLKPSNILISASGQPRITDFGLATSLQERRVSFALTQSGVVAGTVEYLAPECYLPDHRPAVATDLYALGVMFYELLTGSPPRGAWAPVSQLKKIDVRVDELLREATAPDPAQRLTSAAVFQKRLEEIRDSRPRYAGTPFLTRPVRLADLVWTFAGLYLLVAGYCSQQSVYGTDVPKFFDLTFDHSELLGGFWAVFVITLALALLFIWQGLRLWHFRRVPFREALPQPFGLRFGQSRGAAVLVLLAQAVCLWGPLYFLLLIASQTWVWLSPEVPIWGRALCIMPVEDYRVVSPWTWDPSAFFFADAYRIREVQPGIEPQRVQSLDSQSFFVFTQPLALALGAATIFFSSVATTWAGVLGCWRDHRRWLLPSCVLAVAGFLAVAADLAKQRRILRDYAGDVRLAVEHNYLDAAAKIGKPLLSLVNATFDGSGSAEDMAQWADAAFADTVHHHELGSIDRATFTRWLTEKQRAIQPHHASFGTLGGIFLWGADPLVTGSTREVYTDAPESPPTGRFVTIHLTGTLEPGHLRYHRWASSEQPLYIAAARLLGPEEATAWADDFLQVLNAPGCPDLEQWLLPILLDYAATNAWHFTPTTRETFASRFRSHRQARYRVLSFDRTPGMKRDFRREGPVTIQPLTGGRHSLAFALRDLASLTPALERLHWTLEIVYVDGRWQLLRMKRQ